MLLYRSRFNTPIGTCLGVATEYGLFSLTFQDDDLDWVFGRITRYLNIRNSDIQYAKNSGTHKSKVLAETERWVDDYFSGKLSKLKAPTLDLQGTPFELKTWRALLKVPLGETASYGDMARKIRQPTAVRAVGRAVGANPIALLVPCHRIIGSNGKLVGFRSGLDRKSYLLTHEGVL